MTEEEVDLLRSLNSAKNAMDNTLFLAATSGRVSRNSLEVMRVQAEHMVRTIVEAQGRRANPVFGRTEHNLPWKGLAPVNPLVGDEGTLAARAHGVQIPKAERVLSRDEAKCSVHTSGGPTPPVFGSFFYELDTGDGFMRICEGHFKESVGVTVHRRWQGQVVSGKLQWVEVDCG